MDRIRILHCLETVGSGGVEQRRLSLVEGLDSAREAFGLVLVEAMFACLPVVATRVGGIPSVLNEGVTGLSVPPGDLEALPQAILALWRKPEVARDMGAKGRARVISECGVDTYVSAVNHVHSKMLSSRVAAKKAI